MKTLGCNPVMERQHTNNSITSKDLLLQLTSENFGFNITCCLPPPSLAAANNEDHDADKDTGEGDKDAELPHVPDQVLRAHLLLRCHIHALVFSVLSQLCRPQSLTELFCCSNIV